ncbi:MAG: 16S rRNA (uracil(1498)-N(3))-methyltransferase [Dongiaceae bacterium]
MAKRNEGEPGIVARLYVDAPLGDGVPVLLDADRAHYLKNVLRLGPGAAIGLFNGRDGEWRARIDRLDRREARLIADAATRRQSASPDLWLVFAPLKRQRIDWLVEKATELGVARLLPVVTRRTVVARVNLDRLRAHAIEAAEQTERLDVPIVDEPVTLEKLLSAWPSQREILLCAEAGDAQPLADALNIRRTHNLPPMAVMTGPEGGYAREELDALRALPFVTPVGLGPRILRADTAALAALASWQAMLGDGSTRPPARG